MACQSETEPSAARALHLDFQRAVRTLIGQYGSRRRVGNTLGRARHEFHDIAPQPDKPSRLSCPFARDLSSAQIRGAIAGMPFRGEQREVANAYIQTNYSWCLAG